MRNFLQDSWIWDLRENRKDKAKVAAWAQAGRPVPPPDFVKRRTLANYGSAFNVKVLVETGTFMGGTLYALKDHFKTLYSIELSAELAEKARQRFRGVPQINIIQGDSGEQLAYLLTKISEPTVFWLDGHFSSGLTAQAEKDTPIVEELRSIFAHSVKDHVILIDDARLFVGTHDYPTIDELRKLFAEERPTYDFTVVNDIIRAHPARKVATDYS